MKSILRTLLLPLLACMLVATTCIAQDHPPSAKIETSYESEKDRTVVRLAKVQIAGEQDKYKSLQMSPSFNFPGKSLLSPPAIIDFEMQTVVNVKRLSTDLYVVFVIDGEEVFLSSSRWAIKRPVPGRVWIGEGFVFRMPYETFVRITKAKTFALKFAGVVFPVSDPHLQMLRELLKHMQPQE